MKTCKPVKTWTKTAVQNLVRHKGGTYYARIFEGGKERWKSLKTKVQEIAKARLGDELRGRGEVRPAKSSAAGRMTMEQAIERLTAEAEAGVQMPGSKRRNRPLRASSANYRKETVAALRRSWLEILGAALGPIEVRKVSRADVKKWADRYRHEVSSTRFNNTLGTLRRLFEIAIADGELHQNPAREILRSDIVETKTKLPDRAEFGRLVDAIRDNKTSRYSANSADFVEFLAYTGARKTEAFEVLWSDVNFTADEITFRITKSGLARTIPMIAEARQLLEKIRHERGQITPGERVLAVSEARASIDTAAAKIGMIRITHHDLRKLFATTAIECGADVPTVADWLGHQDGGALLLKTYRKAREDHSRRMAGKVSFGQPAANVVEFSAASQA